MMRTPGDRSVMSLTIWGGEASIDESILAYTGAVERDPTDKHAWFRLGVAYRMRHEAPSRQSGDFRSAVDAWTTALNLDPNQYIWRRRLEQYGPRLAKPYPFYDWVEQARKEITDRGGSPVPLVEEPSGSEIAGPVQEVVVEDANPVNPDPDGRIDRDVNGLIEAEVVVIPPRVKPGEAARVHVYLRPSILQAAHWNNESTPLQLWVSGPAGWTIASPLLEAEPGKQPESDEVRHLDFEVKAPALASGTIQLNAFTLYNVCEQTGGQCLFLRQDLPIEIEIDGDAVPPAQ